MHIFVAGGTGFVGQHLVQTLISGGHRVTLLVHGEQRHAHGVETVRGDVTDPAAYRSALAGCDAVINLVGIIREFPARGITFERLHVQAPAALAEAAREAGVDRFLQMSALGSRPDAVSEYHRSKFRGEEEVRRSGLTCTIFRPSVIFGPGDSFVTMLAGYVRNYPLVPVVGSGEYRLQPVAVSDVARCFELSLQMPDTFGRAFEICGKDRLSYNGMLDVIGRVLGKERVHKLKSPLTVMKLVVPLLQNFPAFPLTTDQMIMLLEENICDGGWQKTFRFEPLGFEEGIRTYL